MKVPYTEYVDAVAALGMPDIFPPHLLKFWLHDIPPEYVVTVLMATSNVQQTIEMWLGGVPLEYASVA